MVRRDTACVIRCSPSLLTSCRTANNTEGVYKRGVTLGFVIGWGNLNGVVSSNIYRATDKPKYRIGHGVVMAHLILFLTCGSALQYTLLRSENAKRRAGKRDGWIAGKSEKEIGLLGDKRYVAKKKAMRRRLLITDDELGLIFYTCCDVPSIRIIFKLETSSRGLIDGEYV